MMYWEKEEFTVCDFIRQKSPKKKKSRVSKSETEDGQGEPSERQDSQSVRDTGGSHSQQSSKFEQPSQVGEEDQDEGVQRSSAG